MGVLGEKRARKLTLQDKFARYLYYLEMCRSEPVADVVPLFIFRSLHLQ